MSAVESVTVTLQLAWKTHTTSGALTCTTVSSPAAASVVAASASAPAHRIDCMIVMVAPCAEAMQLVAGLYATSLNN